MIKGLSEGGEKNIEIETIESDRESGVTPACTQRKALLKCCYYPQVVDFALLLCWPPCFLEAKIRNWCVRAPSSLVFLSTKFSRCMCV